MWSFSIPKPQVLVMNKELKIHVPVKFERKGEELLPFLESCWRILVRKLFSFPRASD